MWILSLIEGLWTWAPINVKLGLGKVYIPDTTLELPRLGLKIS